MSSSHTPIEIVYIYADKDKDLHDALDGHLGPFKRSGLITIWDHTNVLAGTTRLQQIEAHINSASVILVLISKDLFVSEDYTDNIQLIMERHNREEVSVIPILLRSCDWEYEPFAGLQVLPRDKKPVIVRDDNKQDEAFTEIVDEIRSVVVGKISQGIINHLLDPVNPLIKPLSSDQQERMKVLTMVRGDWIDQVLTPQFDVVGIEQFLEDRPDMVKPRWPEQERSVPQASLEETTIALEYGKAKHRLLILGDPKAGKTMFLLQLTSILIKEAEKDEAQPIPIVFDLFFWSSWAKNKKRLLLREWLIEEMYEKYQVPRQTGENWIDKGQVIPLLDGLDKVTKDVRSSCIQSINDYLKIYVKNGMVVCCRSKDYEEHNEGKKLSSHILLQLQRAISIDLPLSDKQVDVYFEQRLKEKERVKEIKKILKENNEISEIVKIKPYMLNSLVSIYLAGELIGQRPEKVKEAIFDEYIHFILPNRSAWGKQKKVIEYLAFIAKHMAKPEHRDQYKDKAFVVEHLRPTWLTPRLKIVYRVCAVLLAGTLAGALVGMLVELFFGSPLGFFYGLFCGLVIGWEVGRDTIIERKEILSSMLDRIRKRWEMEQERGKALGELFLGGISWVVVFVIWLVPTLFLGLFRLVALLFVWLFVELKDSVNLAGRVWEWQYARPRALVGLGVGLFFGLIVDQLYGLNGGLFFGLNVVPLVGLHRELFFEQDGGLLVVVIFVLFWMLVGGLIEGLRGGFSRIQSPSGEDIRRSAQNGLIFGFSIGLIVALLFGVVAAYIGGVTIGLIFGLVLGLVGALIVALIFGLDAFVQHFIVHFLLWSRGHVPWKFTTFLDKVVEWSLLQKGDNGYAFEPPQLFEYFATLETEEKKRSN